MANITTQTIRVDLSTDKVIPSAFTHQNDTARTLEFSIYNKGMPYTMTGNTVKFAYKSPIVDGAYTVITGSGMASGTVSGNKVTVTLPSTYTAISGVGMLTMIITPTSGTVRPVNIRLVVQKSADGDDTVMGASDFPEGLYDYMDNWLAENEPTEIANLKSNISEVGEFTGIVPLNFELGGLYAATGLPYETPNIRTQYVNVTGGKAVCFKNPNGKTVAVFEYNDTTTDRTTRTSFSDDNHIISLKANTTVIRLQVTSSPSNLADGDGIFFYYTSSEYADTIEYGIDVINGGIMESWNVTPSIKATLYNNGKFVISGVGEAGGDFSASNLPPWNSNRYMRCIKSIEFDDRITYRNLQFWFTQYDSNGTPIYYNNKYDGSLVLPRNTRALATHVFGQFDCHHFNLCNMVSTGEINFAPNSHKKFILSVPSSLCETTNIINSITNTAMPYVFQNNVNVNNPTAVMLVITDDNNLYEAILNKIDELASSRGSLCNSWTNCLCIKCDDLANDGFPASWTEPMKRCIMEIIPYLGRQSMARETNDIDSETLTFGYNGLTTLGNYGGYGYPQVFSPKAMADIFTHTKSATRRFAEELELGILDNYLGQPYSTELSNMASGLSCSGLISFIFWRYFNENFSLANSKGYVTNKGHFGNNLPLVEIQRDEVKPFDICCMAYDLNEDGELTDADNGGHTAIVLSTREVNGEKEIYVLQALMGIGIVFGTWNYETETGKIVKYKRLSKGGISENMIT